MSVRQSISKKTRFEIFKRDLFTCQYCGNQPPETTLVIDHIHPVKEGGGNDEMNLITSCLECNQGKGARVLENMINRPDADLKWLEMQQEIAELKRYQSAKQEREKLYISIIEGFWETWIGYFGIDEDMPSDVLFRGLLNWASPSQIDRAIIITSEHRKYLFHFNNKFKYLCGVLHNIVNEEIDQCPNIDSCT